MAPKTILTVNQQKILDVICADDFIAQNFYLSGGTALAEFYLRHRLSEDLDFFSEKEFEPQAISVFWKKNQKKLGIKKSEFQQSFNRNLFFLKIGKETIKTEFTYYPFPRIEKKKKIGKLYVDSILDIAVNKIFTIYQNPRSRDFIDLYLICQKENLAISDLVKKAKIKFDWHIDPFQLGAQFMLAETVKDYPRMLINIKPEDWKKFFLNEAKKIGKQKII